MNKVTFNKENGLMTLRAVDDCTIDDLLDWYLVNRETVTDLLHEHGGILLRGFKIDEVSKFEKFLEQLPESRGAYIDGNSPRTKLSSEVYTSTEFPAEFPISMHNELSYSNDWPQKLYFCCAVAPQTEGHTRIADCRQIIQDLDDSIVEQFSKKKVIYTRFLHGGYGVGPSWQDTFETDDRSEVEAFCAKGDIDYQWNDDGSIQLSQQGPGVITHPETNEIVWFNQADQFHISNLPEQIATTLEMLTKGDKSRYPTYAYFADGSEIPVEMLTQVRETFERNIIYFDWEKGDLLIIDNLLMAHGRSPFTGDRKVLVAMT